MNYPNVKIACLCALPWIVAGAILYRLRIYLPIHTMLFMVLGLVVILTAILVWVRGRLATLGGDSANSQPAPTTESNAHDACQPLAPAPLPQRRPWALPSTRSIILGLISITFGLAMAHNYTETAEFIPVSRIAYQALVALVGVCVTTTIATVFAFLCLIDDAFEEGSNSPEADARRES